jgi:hypothetical protein
MTLEHVVDVRHACHKRSMTAEGGLRPPDLTTLRRGEAGWGACPPPVTYLPRKDS